MIFLLAIVAILGLIGARYFAGEKYGRKRHLRFTQLTLPALAFAELLINPGATAWIAAILFAAAGWVALVIEDDSFIHTAMAVMAGVYAGYWLITAVWTGVQNGIMPSLPEMLVAIAIFVGILAVLSTKVEHPVMVAGALFVVFGAMMFVVWINGNTSLGDELVASEEQIEQIETDFNNRIDELTEQIDGKDQQIEALEADVDRLTLKVDEQALLIEELTVAVEEKDLLIAELNQTLDEYEGRIAELDEALADRMSDEKRANIGSTVAGLDGTRSVNTPVGVRRFAGNMSEFGLPACTYWNEPGYSSTELLRPHLANLSDELLLRCNDEFTTVVDGDVIIQGNEIAEVWEQSASNDATWEFAESNLVSDNQNDISAQFANDNQLRVDGLNALEDALTGVLADCVDGPKTSEVFRGRVVDGEIVYDEIVDTKVIWRECARDIVLVRQYDVDGNGTVDAVTRHRIHCGFQMLTPVEEPPPATTTTTTTPGETTTTTLPPELKITVSCIDGLGNVLVKSQPAVFISVENGPLLRVPPAGLDLGQFTNGTYDFTYGNSGDEYSGSFVVDCDQPTTTTTQPPTTTTTQPTTTTTQPTTTTTIPEELSFKVKMLCNTETWMQDIIISEIIGSWDKFEIGEFDIDFTGQATIMRSFEGDLVALVKVLGYPADGSAPVEMDVHLIGDCIQPDFKPWLECDPTTGKFVLSFHQKDGTDNRIGEFISFNPPMDGSYQVAFEDLEPITVDGELDESRRRMFVTGQPKYGELPPRPTNVVEDNCSKTTTTTVGTTTTTKPTTTTTMATTTTTTKPTTTTTTQPTTTTTTQPTTTTTTKPTTTTTTAPTTTTTMVTTTTLPPVVEDFKPELIPLFGGGYQLTFQTLQGEWKPSGEYRDPTTDQWVAFSLSNLPDFGCELNESVLVKLFPLDGDPASITRSTNRVDGNCPVTTTTTQPGTPSSTTSTTLDPRPHPTTTTTTTLPPPPPGDF